MDDKGLVDLTKQCPQWQQLGWTWHLSQSTLSSLPTGTFPGGWQMHSFLAQSERITSSLDARGLEIIQSVFPRTTLASQPLFML